MLSYNLQFEMQVGRFSRGGLVQLGGGGGNHDESSGPRLLVQLWFRVPRIDLK